MSNECVSAMAKRRHDHRVRIWTPVSLALSCILLLLSMQWMLGNDLFRHSTYNSYTLQALQWREGKTVIEGDYTWLELAVYDGEFYVSFPPVPTVPVFFLTFIWGEDVPDALLIQLYSVIACLLAYLVLKRAYGSPATAAVWAFLLCFASSMLPLLQDGAVWYQAQVLAFLLTVGAIERTQKGKLTAGLLLFALSVGCRPFNVLYGPLLLMYALQTNLRGLGFRKALVRLLPGILLGLAVAAAYAWYNYIRFGNPLEFGHNYLPEFSAQGRQLLSAGHILDHIPVFITGLPLMQTADGLALQKFGFSLFLASPVFICYILWMIRDIKKGRVAPMQAFIFAAFALHVLLLLSHRTGGGFQYGARYFVDCIPYVLLYLAVQKGGENDPPHIGLTKRPWVESILMYAGLIHNVVGIYFINL